MSTKYWAVRVALLGILTWAPASVVYGQPSEGDKEIGVAGALSFNNSSPVTGTFFGNFSAGKYFRDNMYLGAYVAPTVNFGGGASFGSFAAGGEFEYGFKVSNDKLWPFVGSLAGFDVNRAGGGGGSSWSGFFQLAPEAGVKYFVDKKTSVEVVLQFPIQFGTGGAHSETQILFGLRHIL